MSEDHKESNLGAVTKIFLAGAAMLFLFIGPVVYLKSEQNQGSNVNVFSKIHETKFREYVKLSGKEEFTLKNGFKYKVRVQISDGGALQFATVVETSPEGAQRVVFSTNQLRDDLTTSGWFDDQVKEQILNYIGNELVKLR